MNWPAGVGTAVGLLVLAVASVWLMPLRCELLYRRCGRGEVGRVMVTVLWGRAVYRYRVGDGDPVATGPPAPGARPGRTGLWSRVTALFRNARRVGALTHEVVGRLAVRARFQEVRWESEVGGSDPARTAVSSGWAWAIKGAALGTWQHRVARPGSLRVAVRPRFDRTRSETEFGCIFSLRGGNIVTAILPALSKFFLKR